MSTGAQIAVLSPGAGRRARAGAHADSTPERPLVRVAAFAALGLYGVLRWGTLLSPTPTWRLLGLLGLAGLFAGLGGELARLSRVAAALAGAAAIIAVFPLAGVPLAWVWHERIAVTTDAISQGLGALPRVLVPYAGINPSVRIVILLGAGVLLLDAAFVLAFTPRALGDLRRAGAALPLVALAVVPSTLARPGLPYVHGLFLFVLLAAFIWGERVSQHEVGAACLICVFAAAGALIAAPGLDAHKPWLNYEALAGTLSPTHLESFSWNQTYGRLRWPRKGREVLDVQAAHPEYWKAENLDVFDGYSWTEAPQETGQITALTDRAVPEQAKSWTQTIKVTLRAMSTSDVIGAGVTLAPPQHISGAVQQGSSPGTFVVTGTELGPGDSYSVEVYTPLPSASQLRQVSESHQSLPADLSVGLPRTFLPVAGGIAPSRITFPPFHSGQSLDRLNHDPSASTYMALSPYGGAFALAQRLAATAPSAYDYVRRVMSYLAQGFTYNESPPRSQYPLESFLFKSKLGYCQQFSGAMALLLRMGGIPARVAAGFTTGSFDAATHQYVVTDIDAHDWVEAWFPRYGWVRFDPTPGADPALSGQTKLASLAGGGSSTPVTLGPKRPEPVPASTPSTAAKRGGGSPDPVLIGAAILATLLALAVLFRFTRRASEPDEDQLLAELERALRRAGRPISVGTTLVSLEQRFRSSPEAVGYIRALRLARFAGAAEPPTSEQRRALRAQLRAGLGLSGAVRALWALPPRWGFLPRRGGIKSS